MAHGRGQQHRREEQKRDVHGQDVKQRRAIDQQRRSNDGNQRVRKIKIEQMIQGCLVGMHSKGRRYREEQRQHGQVIGIDLERALPQPGANPRGIFERVAHIDTAHQQRRHENETLRRRDKPDGLVDKVAEARRKVSERHPDQEEPAQCVEFGAAFQIRKLHAILHPVMTERTLDAISLDASQCGRLFGNIRHARRSRAR